MDKKNKSKHGGNIYSYIEKYGIEPNDFSSNLSFFDYKDKLQEIYEKSFQKCFSYPDENYCELTNAIANFENIESCNITVSNGASELINIIPFVLKSKKTLLFAPTFNEYAERFSKVSEIYEYILKHENSFKIQNDFYEKIKEVDTVIIVNPNNPTGNIIKKDELRKIIKKCSEFNVNLIIDECFMDLSIQNESVKEYIDEYDKLMIIKALTKSFSLAGIRIGYLISNKYMVETVNSYLPTWRVSNIADILSREVLKYKEDLNSLRKMIKEEIEFVSKELKKLNIKVYESYTNFIFFQCNMLDLADKMEKEGFLIRDCSNFSNLYNKGYFRIAIKSRRDNTLLINSMKKIFKINE